MTDIKGPLIGKMTRRSVIVGATMAATAGAAYAMRPRAAAIATAPKLGRLIPHTIGPWKFLSSDGLVVARAEEDEEGPADGYDQLVTRVYSAEGRPTIMLLLAYGAAQGGGLQLHRPETCYPGQGFGLHDFSDIDLRFSGSGADVRCRRFTATRDERSERLIYWTRIATSFPRNTLEEYRAILSSAIAGSVADGLLVRLSTLDTDIAQADAALQDFARVMIAAAPAAGQTMLIGAPAQG